MGSFLMSYTGVRHLLLYYGLLIVAILVIWNSKQVSSLDFVLNLLKDSLITMENSPIMLIFCFILSQLQYYAKNYVDIIEASLLNREPRTIILIASLE